MQNALLETPIEALDFLVFPDSCLYLDEVLKSLNQQKSVMLVLPMQLGIDKMTPEYLPSLKYTFEMPSTLGFAGGQAKRSFYFTGLVNPHVWDDPYLTYLDPHFVQEAVKDPTSLTAQELESFHCSDIRLLKMSKLSSSLLLGFYIKSLEEFKQFFEQVDQLANMPNSILQVFSKRPEEQVHESVKV